MNFSIRQRLFGLLGIVAIGLVALVVVSIFNYRSMIIEQTRTGLSNYVSSAHSIMAGYAAKAAEGEMSEADAKKFATAAIGAMRYANSGYFWIHDLEEVMIMHPMKPALNGKDLTTLEDKAGNRLFVGMNKAIGEGAGAGFYEYYWGKPGADKEASFLKESYVKLFKPWGYVVGTGVYIDDLNARVWSAIQVIAILAVIMFVVLGAVSYFIAQSIARPLTRIRGDMLSLADGETDIEIYDAKMPSDLIEMARTVGVFRDNAVERAAMAASQDSEQGQRQERQARVDQLIADFRASSEGSLSSVSDFMGQLQTAAKSLTGIAESTSDQATATAAASEEASTNVQTVASAAEELSASIAEISGQVVRTTEIVGEATTSTQAANEKVSALAEAAQKIGDIVNLIQGIAEQTNLLALNATIEAARAGEMGKGFAVVASEVKTLANETAKATEEIAGQVSFVQSSTEEAVTAIDGIAKTMDDVNKYTTMIADAVEEQGAATTEISRNVSEAASGTQMAAENMSSMMTAVSETNESADNVERTSLDATQQTDELRQSINQFLDDVAAA